MWPVYFRNLSVCTCVVGCYVIITDCLQRGTRRRSWLRHCATSRKVVGSIPDCVIGSFHLHNPSGRTMAIGFTQPLNRYEYQEYFPRVKVSGLKTLPPSCDDCLEIRAPQPPGTLRAFPTV
jgi:hypothetical protein